VLVRPLALAEGQALARRLLAALAARPVLHDGHAIGVSGSIGHAAFPLRNDGAPALDGTGPALDWERAIALVDRAMYIAKAQGRNRACGVVSVRAADRQAMDDLASALETAWQDGRADLHLQAGPAVSAAPP
jgi:hypothetical protein